MISSERIKSIVERIFGLSVDSIGEETLLEAVAERSKALDVDPTDYAEILETDAREIDEIAPYVTVRETWFFRDEAAFDRLKDLAPVLLQTKGRIRILSAPCSGGEEPYSIAASLFGLGLDESEFSIDAVDMNPRAIEKARRGEYSGVSFRNDYDGFREKHFERVGDKFIIDDKLKNAVNFEKANLTDESFPFGRGAYEVIFCKNLLIYLNEPGRIVLRNNIRKLLASDGVMFAGHSEIMNFRQAGFVPDGPPSAFSCRLPSIVEKKVFSPPKKIEKVEKLINIENVESTRIGKASEKKESEGRPCSEKALSLADAGEYEAAIDECVKCEEIDKSDERVYFARALASEALGREGEALKFYNKALYLNPYHYESLANLYLIHKKNGAGEKAEILKNRIEKISGRKS